jgi:argonaute-like protein implicated in RNA metabolism and viral defense
MYDHLSLSPTWSAEDRHNLSDLVELVSAKNIIRIGSARRHQCKSRDGREPGENEVLREDITHSNVSQTCGLIYSSPAMT